MDPDGRTLSRVERRRLATREEILRVAGEMLLEVGPEELSLRQVAHRAGFSPGALYTYFSSRDEIIASLLKESFARLDAYIRRVPSTLEPPERVVELAMAYMDFARDNPVDLRCILNGCASALMPESGLAMGLDAARLIGQTFREGVEKGVFAPPHAQSAAEMTYGLWALVHGMALLSGVDLSGVKDEVAADPRRALEAYVAGLTGGRRET
jgi:AcrR family transcriptional regulator